jgi:hypothetical protein
MITLKLLDSIATINKNINKSIAELVNQKIFKNQSKILRECKKFAINSIKNQPEIISLLNNVPESLSGQFGIPEGRKQSIVAGILFAIENSIQIRFVKYNEKLRGGLEIYFQPSSFINLLSLPEGHVLYQGGDLHWLDWLIKRGDNIIVVNYQYNPQTGLGRSNLGNMIPGNSFRVPPEFSGTMTDNFITRALIGKSQEQQIFNILQEAFK